MKLEEDQALEAYAFMGVFCKKLCNSVVLFDSVNRGVMEVINKMTSLSKVVMRIVRPLVLLQIKQQNEMKVQAEEIPHQFKSSNFKIKQTKTSSKHGAQPLNHSLYLTITN